MSEQLLITGQKPRSWTPQEAPVIYQHLEVPNWAPWLAASMDSLAERSQVFQEGQIVLMGLGNLPLASLSTNRIFWDGNRGTLPTWDDVAGDPTTYEKTYIPNGNTLVLMSMNVTPTQQGKGLTKIMLEHMGKVAQKIGIQYVIGSFRPSEFGKFKAIPGNAESDFGDYCNLTREEDGLPKDAWIRSLTRNGMKPLAVDRNAMTVPVSLDEFIQIMNSGYNQGMWQEVAPDIWECGEVGRWIIDRNLEKAIYKESNLWGIIQKT